MRPTTPTRKPLALLVASVVLLALVVAAGFRTADAWRQNVAVAAARTMPTAELRSRIRALLQDPAATGNAASPSTFEFDLPSASLAEQNITTRANLPQLVGVGTAAAMLEFSGNCVYGLNCGSKCDSKQNGVRRYRTENGSPDPLDYACMDHDKCLDRSDGEITQFQSSWSCPLSSTVNCFCDGELWRKAWEVHNSEKKDCSLLNFFCWETNRVMGAQMVALSMEYKLSCGKCANGLPPNFVPYSPPEQPQAEAAEPQAEENPDSASSSGAGNCAATIEHDVFLELTAGPDDSGNVYQPVSDWEECCSLCGARTECGAWSFSPGNKRCDNGPCCFLRGSTGYTVIDKPGGRVSGVYGGTFPAIGTVV